MSMLKRYAIALAIFAGIASFGISLVVGIGLIVGYILHSLIPSIDLGIATLCGVCAVRICVYALVGAVNSYKEIQNEQDSDQQEQFDEEGELLRDELVDRIADQVTEAVMVRMVLNEPHPRPRSRSRR